MMDFKAKMRAFGTGELNNKETGCDPEWRITASGDFWVVRWGCQGPWDCEAGELQKIYIVKSLKYPTVR